MKIFSSLQERRTYQCWADMRSRCRNPRHKRWSAYGGRGITVCSRWDSFERFVEDMGLRPDGLTLERVDNDRGYAPDNCTWADYRAQNKNKRNTTKYEYQGKSQTIEEWALEMGMPRTMLSQRIHRYGWDIETALMAPAGHRHNVPDDPDKRKFLPALTADEAAEIRQLHAGGFSLRQIARRYGVSQTAVANVVSGKTHNGGGS